MLPFSPKEQREIAESWKRGDLVDRLAKILEGQPLEGWPSGKCFEHVIIRAFMLEGAEVRWPYNVMDPFGVEEQIDGCVRVGELWALVEAKDEADNVSADPIAKMKARLARRPAQTLGLLFARKGFTEAAKAVTRTLVPLQILLWEGSELRKAVDAGTMVEGLQKKWRLAVQEGIPDINLTVLEDER
jgi:hypothetical protein